MNEYNVNMHSIIESNDRKYQELMQLNNKNIIVTGACGLLGQEICKAIIEFGGTVIAADINEGAGNKLANDIAKNFKDKLFFYPLDITSEDSCNSIINYVVDNFGEIHGLVNNAYPRNNLYGTVYEEVPYESWRENIDLHLNGYFNITHKTTGIMQKQRFGNIINMCSIYGMVGPDFSIYEGTKMTNPVEYSTIKGGLLNLTRYLASYLGKYNIRVNSVSPGGIFDRQNEHFIENYIAKTPLGRMGRPEDIACGVVFLLSEFSSFITGHNLVIDGGWTAV